MGHRGNDKLVQPRVGLNLKSLKDRQVELLSREAMQIRCSGLRWRWRLGCPPLAGGN